MLVSSTLNPSHKSSTSFVVLSNDNSRVIVPTDSLPKYSDVLEFVRREWRLDSNLGHLMLETNELDVCAGGWVRIHEEAWPGLKDVVGTVHVNRGGPVFDSKAQVRIASTHTSVVVPELPSSSRLASIKKEGARQTTESADEGEVEQQVVSEDNEGASERSTDYDDAEEHEVGDATVLPPASPIKGDALNLFGDVSEEKTPASKKAFSRVDKESTPTTAKPSSSTKRAHTPSSSALKPRSAAATASGLSTKTNSTTASRSVSPVKEATSLKDPSTPAAAAVAQIENTDPNRVLILVEIIGLHEPKPFRIRKDYTVHSVLKGVSKVFDFDYSRASLRKVLRNPRVPYEDEDEEEELETTKLERTDTMRSLGVEDRQRFVVDVTGEEDESD